MNAISPLEKFFHALNRPVLLCVLGSLLAPALGWSADESRTESKLAPFVLHSTKPLIGYVPVRTDAFYVSERQNTAGIPAHLFMDAAKADPEFDARARKLGSDPSHLNLTDWFKVSKSLADLQGKNKESSWKKPKMSVKGLEQTYLAPEFAVKSVDTELFPSAEPSTFFLKYQGKDVEYIRVDYGAAKTFIATYELLASTNPASPVQAQRDFQRVSASMSTMPLLANAVQQKFAEVGFGNPVVYTAKERNIVAPRSITTNGDVYLVQFAISLKDLEPRELDYVTFGVKAPAGVMAVELIPYRFAKEISERRIVSSPQVKINVNGRSIELGEFYREEKEFSSRRPTLYASGLQQNSFWWTLKEDAIQEGSHRFVAVLQVPKAKEQVTVLLSLTAKLKDGWLSQGGIISASAEPIDIPLVNRR